MADLTAACGESPNVLCEAVFDWTDSAAMAKAADWLVDRPLRIVLIIIVAAIVARVVGRAITRFADRLVPTHMAPVAHPAGEVGAAEVGDTTGDGELAMADEDGFFGRGVERLRYLGDQQVRAGQRAQTLGVVLRSLTRVAIWFVAFLLILGELDINLAPLIASAGIAGVAIGFGAQSMVKDFLAGIFIVIEDQYGVGDIVDVGPIGTVEEVTLRTTKLRDAAGVLWVVPNGEIRRVGNTSQLWSKSLLDIEVSYETDIDHATEVIKGVLDALWHERLEEATIIEEPEVLGVEAFGPDAIVIRAVVKTDPGEQFIVARTIRARLKKAFDATGIEIPFPQRTVWVKKSPDPDQQPDNVD